MRMRAAMLAHEAHTRLGVVSLIASALFGLLTALATLFLGVTRYPTAAAGTDVVALAVASWLGVRLAYAAFAGGGSTLRFEVFRSLPIPLAKLARALLIVGALDPALLFIGLAFSALIALGAQQSATAAVIGAVGGVLTLALCSVLTSMVGALLPSGSRRRRDFGTMVVAVAISIAAVAATLLPVLGTVLTSGSSPALSLVLRVLPSGWAAVAVEGARNGNAAEVILPLLGLCLLIAGLVSLWPRMLSRRMDGTVSSSTRGSARRGSMRWGGRRLLPQSPRGAVIAKELRLWVRDPIRVTFLMIAAIVGLGSAVIPDISHGTSLLLPFAGAGTVIIAAGAASNLYGSDGPSLALTIVTPRAAEVDIRGRQGAWLLLVGPYALIVSVVLTVLSGQGWAWPWILGVLPALLGGAMGILALGSVVGVQPLDDSGGPTPAWVLKVYSALILTAITAVPAVALLVFGMLDRSSILTWSAVPIGIATGVLLAVGLGRVASRRLVARDVDILAGLTAASTPA
jgi:ABC-2 type transport system permease protein